MRSIAYFVGFTLAACAVVAMLNECHAFEPVAPPCRDFSDRCLDAWYEHGDETGDYGPIDESCDEDGDNCTEEFNLAFAQYRATKFSVARIIRLASQDERDAAEDMPRPQVAPAYYQGKRISPYYAPGCADGLTLLDNAECDE